MADSTSYALPLGYGSPDGPAGNAGGNGVPSRPRNTATTTSHSAASGIWRWNVSCAE